MRKEPLAKGVPYALRSTQYFLGETDAHLPYLLTLLVGRPLDVAAGRS
jgi:hypothetical protein